MQKINVLKTASFATLATSFCVACVGNVEEKKRFILMFLNWDQMETLRQIRLNCVDIKKAKDCTEKKEYLNLNQHKTLLK
jgi:hypothetical protein